MPWEEKTVVSQREEFVRRALAKEESLSALCREYGISRPTGYKWIERFLSSGDLADQSRRPFHTPNKIDEESEQKIVKQRKQEPAIGATKIQRMLITDGWENPPAISTINEVLKRNNLITSKASQAATHYIRFEKEKPNVMLQVDFKGNFEMRNGVRCHPLSVLDDRSRFCLCGDAKANEQTGGVKESFTQMFRQYGLPHSILCDNGTPWGASQSYSITKFEVWLMELGVLTTHIRPKRPQTQGKIERFNGSYKRERLAFYTPKDLEDAQRCREEYRDFYNNRRPHCALDLDTPAQHYIPSDKPFPESIKRWQYAEGTAVRAIKKSGYLTFEGHGYYLSEGLANKEVAILPTEKDGVLDLVFRQFRVAKLDARRNVITSRRIYLLENDPREKV